MQTRLKYHYGKIFPEAGCDEAGRGCLAGPVVAAAVILPDQAPGDLLRVLNDSKKLSVRTRLELRLLIEEQALAFGVAMVDNVEIDRINILNASIKAMHLAIRQLIPQPGFLLIDGNRFKSFGDIPHQCIVKGDGKYASVAAASILAKTWRDAYMQVQHEKYPDYGWDQNKGYPTPAHKLGVRQQGITPLHRRSFKPVCQLEMAF